MERQELEASDVQQSVSVTMIGVFLIILTFWAALTWKLPETGAELYRPEHAYICTATPQYIYVNVFARGGYAVDGNAVSGNQLLSAVRSADLRGDSPYQASVVLDVERDASVGEFVRALDVSRQLGLQASVLEAEDVVAANR